jgi:nucleotide-binding universal stress UspA family protein
MYPRILVAVDGSEAAHKGLAEAIRLARPLGSRILLVHVVNKTPRISPDIDQAVLQHLIDGLRGTGESLIHDATADVRDEGIEVDSRLIEALGADAGEIVVKEALSWPASLIVCGTHGRRGLRRLLMGRDAEYIVRHSPVPVLLVRASESPAMSSGGGHEQ